MPVIINEFEVVAEAPERAAGTPSPEPAEEQAPAAPPLRPIDIIQIEEHHRRRMARLAAD